ncbi:polymorphic toxin-type HINT domain-containing protein [Thermoactinospora rubra]|uniref:polymorphic toxin-type HINT domain-containing protein n=1 Tax=Thermoactinospora rubra TaxID=1088767 RepID=UPI000A113748
MQHLRIKVLRRPVESALQPSAGESNDGSAVIATAAHPFWVASLEAWALTGELRPGQWLKTSTGTWAQISSIQRWIATQPVYNLTVADIHTYHVVVSDTTVLVHNSAPCGAAVVRQIADRVANTIAQGHAFEKHVVERGKFPESAPVKNLLK